MSPDEALSLIDTLHRHGIELRQRGRLLLVERGAEKLESGLRGVIARHWPVVAAAVTARRQAGRALARAEKAAKRLQRENVHE